MTLPLDKTAFSAPAPLASHTASAFVFEDPASHALLARIARIGPSDANVLVIGETGSGKELIARMLHAHSARADRQFVAVNCGALSETLADSELFGHERGAFTGAAASKPGWFEAANGGTLFLDEIGDLPLSIQVKLLRVLQEREVVRLGSRTPAPIDVRLIAATNVNLAEAVALGRFREDLYYRLRVGAIEATPLRERRGDILPLARYFVDKHRARGTDRAIAISDAAAAMLVSHAWPGNIRELENVVQGALVDTHDGVLGADAIRAALAPQYFVSARGVANMEVGPRAHERASQHVSQRAAQHAGQRAGERARALAQPEDRARDDASALEHALVELFEAGESNLYERIEGAIVSAAYQYCDRNQVQTARLLGLSRNIVRARLMKIGELKGGRRTAPAEIEPDIVRPADAEARSTELAVHD
ncbi:sigma-54 interaction domain-containing protein [Pararobbsia silviterrae]|uniref:Sigma-54 factor interaction domain-containing protein n=1 Tax=Pararobbsia silviterrae TaxID=1792498 RepID=A0A494Y613_9BURK|nr:sigma 54-interacting transcriptional regulator [Pararobbsia silviterrae]RKP55766.1 hypothetical protein D7S86_11130 [Pararobbsia silviterrae]